MARCRCGHRFPAWVLAAAVVLVVAAGSARAQTLAHIRQSGSLRCGVNLETPEYSTSDDHGPRIAFDTDLCRAVGIAILGPDAHIVTVSYPDDVASMDALLNGEVDLVPTLTLDLTHASKASLAFSPPVLYDAVGLLVPSSAHRLHAADLAGRKICFLAETEVEVAVRAWFGRQHLKLVAFPFQEQGEMDAAFVTGNCSAMAGDWTRLAATRAGFGPLASGYELLDDELAQDPLAAASRSDDPAFAAIVRWTFEVLVQGEALGLSSQTIGAAGGSQDPTVQIFTGKTREIGARLGLNNAWATQVIAAAGNYGEIFSRDLGGLPRGLNRLYTQGGMVYPIPLK